MVEHLAYPKVPLIGTRRPPGGPWVLTEKVHGAHLVALSEAGLVLVGKRKAWLEPNEPFFGWQRIRCDIEQTVISVREQLGAKRVRLYGELCGDVVQSGVLYTSGLAVLWFDALVDDQEFLSFSELQALGILTVPLLQRGPHTALTHSLDYESHVPALFGEPAPTPNKAEGWVKRPDIRATLDTRYVVKRKIAAFDESDGVYFESSAFDPEQPVSQTHLEHWARRMVNEARFSSARSKVGGGDVAAEVVLDVLCDLEGAFPGAMRTADQDALLTVVRAAIADFSRK